MLEKDPLEFQAELLFPPPPQDREDWSTKVLMRELLSQQPVRNNNNLTKIKARIPKLSYFLSMGTCTR